MRQYERQHLSGQGLLTVSTVVKTPVDSTTKSAPMSPQGISEGSLQQ